MSKLLIAAMNKSRLLTKDEEVNLITKIQEEDCERSKNELVKANLRFVSRVANGYKNRGLDFEDLMAYGSIGLLRAIETFDLSKGYKFLTYAVWWIKEAIKKALEENRLVPIPANKLRLIRQYREALLKNGGSHEKTIAMVEFAEYKHELHDLIGKTEIASLDAPVNTDDGEVTLGDKMAIDSSAMVNETDTIEYKMRKVVKEQFPRFLDQRELSIMTLAYGIGISAPLTNEEIGKRVNLTGERVRQIRQKTYGKILKDGECRKILYGIIKKD